MSANTTDQPISTATGRRAAWNGSRARSSRRVHRPPSAGLAIAYKAYRISLGGGTASTLDGLTGDQRFYMGWAQVWRSKTRENQAIAWIKTDPHSPDEIRGTVTEMNQAPFYDAFGIKAGDKMYLAPEKRVTLW